MKFQSKFEREVADVLNEARVNWDYETYSYAIRTPIRGQTCVHCGKPLDRWIVDGDKVGASVALGSGYPGTLPSTITACWYVMRSDSR